MRWLAYFYYFSFKWTATAAIGIHPTKAWLLQLVNFKNAIRHFVKCFTLLFDHLAWIEHQFLSSIRDSRKAGSLMIRGVAGVRKSIHQSWLAKGLGLGLLYWGFRLVKTASETYGMLQTAFGASCMNRESVFEWHKRFKEGRESVTFFPSVKQNFIVYRSSKVSDCIFENHPLWQSGFSRVYINCCCSC